MTMAENEITALITQMKKCNQIAKEQASPLSEQQRLEFKTVAAMVLSFAAHRGPGYEITKEQALELATAMIEFRETQIAQGIDAPPSEEAMALADKLMNAPKPTIN